MIRRVMIRRDDRKVVREDGENGVLGVLHSMHNYSYHSIRCAISPLRTQTNAQRPHAARQAQCAVRRAQLVDARGDATTYDLRGGQGGGRSAALLTFFS